MRNAKYLKPLPELNTSRWVCPYCENTFNHNIPKLFQKKIKCRVCNNPLKIAFPDIGFTKLIFICVTLGVFILLLANYSFSPLFHQGSIYHVIAGQSYNAVANHWEENNISQSFANICENYPEKSKQVKCVYELILETQYLATREEDGFFRENSNILRTPEDILIKGGVCRDVTVLASSIFNLLDINNSMIHTEIDGQGHVYNEVYLANNKTCHVDISRGIYYCHYPYEESSGSSKTPKY